MSGEFDAINACILPIMSLISDPLCVELTEIMGANNSSYTEDTLDGMCNSECFPKFTAVMSEFFTCQEAVEGQPKNSSSDTEITTSDFLTSMFEFMCTKNLGADGTYCLANKAVIGKSDDSAGYCDVIAEAGCCYTAALSTFGLEASSLVGVCPGYTEALPVPADCPAPGVDVAVTSANFAFDGLKYAAASPEGKRAIKAAFLEDFAKSSGIPAGDVTIKADSNAAGDLVVTVTVRNDDGTSVETAKAGLSAGTAASWDAVSDKAGMTAAALVSDPDTGTRTGGGSTQTRTGGGSNQNRTGGGSQTSGIDAVVPATYAAMVGAVYLIMA